jgi:hypothetical protein
MRDLNAEDMRTAHFKKAVKLANTHSRLPRIMESTFLAFSTLGHVSKRVCDANVIALEDKLEVQLQSIFFETIENVDSRNSAMLKHLILNTQLSNLQREFIFNVNGSKRLKVFFNFILIID